MQGVTNAQSTPMPDDTGVQLEAAAVHETDLRKRMGNFKRANRPMGNWNVRVHVIALHCNLLVKICQAREFPKSF